MTHRTLIANLSSTDKFDFIYIAVEITDSLIQLLKEAKKILDEHKDCLSGLTISGDTISKNASATEIYAIDIRNVDRGDDFCKVVNYRVNPRKPVHVIFELTTVDTIYIGAIDSNNNLFGELSQVSIPYEDIVL